MHDDTEEYASCRLHQLSELPDCLSMPWPECKVTDTCDRQSGQPERCVQLRLEKG